MHTLWSHQLYPGNEYRLCKYHIWGSMWLTHQQSHGLTSVSQSSSGQKKENREWREASTSLPEPRQWAEDDGAEAFEPKFGLGAENFGPKKLATPKKSWEKPQSAFLDVFCHSEHNGGVKKLQKLLWESLQNLLSLSVWHCSTTEAHCMQSRVSSQIKPLENLVEC